MEKVKYIAVDFDGTILNSNGEISNNLVNKLINLQERGYKMILCSGRSFSGIEWLAKKIHLEKYKGYIVAYNGSQIYEYENGKLHKLQDLQFEADEVEVISNLFKDSVQCLATYDADKMGVTNLHDRMHRSAEVMGLTLDANYLKATPKIILFDEPHVISGLHGEVSEKLYNINPNINVFSSVARLLEITPPLASKGEALKKICDLKGLSHEEFICFGDNGNDLSMFEFCKYSVAMENGIDSIKKIATHHTKTNNEDGVFYFLETHFN